MRPISLKMKAFGPYRNEVTIDFEKLGEKGIYLISGDTGAGKTTIFDAICYALYGELSGDYRNSDHIRNELAADNQETEVRLVFSVQGKKYEITRSPSYIKTNKKDPTKTTTVSAKAVLKKPGDIVISKPTFVTAEVKDLIGLDRKQFKQVCLIAQNDFTKLLMAKSDERLKIFRELFQTKEYEAFQKKVAEAAKKADNSMNAIIHDRDALKKELSDQLGGREITSELLKELITSQQQKLAKTTALRNEEQNKGSEMDTQIGKLQALLKECQKKSNAQKTLDIKEPELTKEQENLENLKSQQSEIDQDKIQISKLENVLKEIVREQNLLNEKKSLEQIKTNLENKRKDLQAGELKIHDAQKATQERLDSLLDTSLEKERTLTQIGKIDQLLTLITRVEEAQINHQKELRKFKNAQLAYEQADEEFKSYQKHFMNQQAGVLASELKEGEKCPVCGSVRHPEPAILEDEDLSSETLKKKEKHAAEKQKSYSKASEENGKANQKLHECIEQFEEGLKAYNPKFTPSQNEPRLHHWQELLEADKKKLTDKMDSLKVIDSKKELLKKIQTKLDSLLSENQRQQSKNEADFNQNNMKLSANEASLREVNSEKQSQAEVEAGIKQAKNKISSYSRKLQETEKLVSNLEKEVTSAKAIVDQGPAEDEKVVEQNLSTLQEQAKNTREKINHWMEDERNLQNNIQIFTRDKKKLEDLDKKYNDELANWQDLTMMDNVINGKQNDKEKVNLETFVQLAFFDEVIQRANERFLKMSGHRYKFVRRDPKGKQSKTGLDLDIIDLYSQKSREVQSLSGGESFLAALCLALGMSDVVSAKAGGIEIETMFLDEGFGSLDRDALDQAMNTLAELGSANRLIGIISHVEELQNRVDHQIYVKKDINNGSSIRIIS